MMWWTVSPAGSFVVLLLANVMLGKRVSCKDRVRVEIRVKYDQTNQRTSVWDH